MTGDDEKDPPTLPLPVPDGSAAPGGAADESPTEALEYVPGVGLVPARPPLPPRPLPPLRPGGPAAAEVAALAAAMDTAGASASAKADEAASAAAPVSRPAAAAKAPRRRRRHRGLLIGAVVTVVVLVALGAVGWFGGNTWARQTVVAKVTAQTRQALHLPAGTPVAVGVDDPMLPQLIRGSLTRLDVTVPSAPLGDVHARLALTAKDVATDGSSLQAATVQATLSTADLIRLIGSLGDTVPGTVKITDGHVSVALNPSQFLSGISFTLTLAPSVKDGALVLTPSAFDVGGFEMSAQMIADRFGSLAQGILSPRRVCIADRLPAGLHLSTITLGAKEVSARFTVDPKITSDGALQKLGTCG